jgi:uncharacterized alkaline shock family protein YloU
MPESSVAGRSIVTRRAITDIIRIAVQGSYGVTGFSDPSLGRRLLRWLGLDRPGVRLDTEGGLGLDLFITVAAGVPIAEVARQVDSAVRYSVRKHLGLEIRSLAIHVDGLRYQPTAVERAHAIETSAAGNGLAGPGEAGSGRTPDGPETGSAPAESPPRRRRRRAR